jgi:hypothetical protein
MNADRKRHFAVQRALKMNILFKGPTYDNVMDALNKPSGTPDPAGCHADAREHDFYAALPASLVKAEKDWLWNYLKHCTKTGTGGWANPPKDDDDYWVPDAASVGW